ncbi:ATP synthase subunit d, mitochondrial [Frankliniella fusca]|uniref:ATP synthase subunit d, mitochondrial n=1 Tax=Frankliniella fusca TaxID=407009 RepID=A0AAE1LUD9_9NEOP|nr:ATP synthase subunit d, mitochondrial [Frankliniella fusca]
MAAGRFAGSKVNWPKLLERFPMKDDANLSKLLTLKKNHEQYLRRLAALPEKAPAIDWAAYKSKLSPAFVDAIKQKYEAISIPYPKSNVDELINTADKELESKADHCKTQNMKIIAELEEEFKKLDAQRPIEEMTLQEYKQAYPDSGPSVPYPTPEPHDDDENSRKWRIYIERAEKGDKSLPKPVY